MNSSNNNPDRKALSWVVMTPGGTVHRTYIEGPPGFEVRSKPDGRFTANPPPPSAVSNGSWKDDLGLKVHTATTFPSGTYTTKALQAPDGYKVQVDPYGYTTTKLSKKWKPTNHGETQASNSSTYPGSD